MTHNIKIKNEAFKELKLRLRTDNRQSFLEIDNILSSVQDRKAFVYLMDAYETEKELTREIIDQMLDNTIDINNSIIDLLEDKSKIKLEETLNTVFTPKNIKSLIIAAVVIGIIVSIATNDNVALKIIDSAIQTQEKKEEK